MAAGATCGGAPSRSGSRLRHARDKAGPPAAAPLTSRPPHEPPRQPGLRRPADHGVRDHVGVGPPARGDQSRAGLPGRPGAGRYPRGRGAGACRGGQPVPADDGAARAPRGGGRTLRPPPGTRARSGLRGDGDLGRDGGAGRGAARAGPARRRGGALRADVRCLPAPGAARGRRAANREPAAAGLPSRRGRARGRVQRAHQRGPAQQSPQSERHAVRTGRPRGACRILPPFRGDGDLRRGLGARRLRRRGPRPPHGPAGHARAHGEDRLGRQDLLAHRLEGRLRDGRRRPDAGAGQGAPVPHLHHPAEPAGGGGARARQGGRLFPHDAGGLRALPRSAGDGARRPRLPGASGRRHVVPQRRYRRAGPHRRRRLLRASRAAARRGGDPRERLLPGRIGAQPRAPVLRQVRRHPRRGAGADGGCHAERRQKAPHPCGRAGPGPHPGS